MKGKKVITAMCPKYSIRPKSRNCHFWTQETESILIIFASSVEEMSISYNKFYYTVPNFHLFLALLTKLVFVSRINHIYLNF